MKCLPDRVHVFTATAIAIAVISAFAALRAQVVTPTAHTTAGAFGAIAGDAAGREAFDTQAVLSPRVHGHFAADAVLLERRAASPAGPSLSLRTSADTAATEAELGASASAALRPVATVRAIHQYPSDNRRQLVEDVVARVDASAVVLARLHRQARTFAEPAKAEFEAAAKAVAWSEEQLRRSLKAASEASFDTWADARAAVAADYAAYAEAVSRAEAVARAQQAAPVSSPGTAPATTAGFTAPVKPGAAVTGTDAGGSIPAPPAVPASPATDTVSAQK